MEVKRRLWPPSLAAKFPSTIFSRLSGDITHLPTIPDFNIAWIALHACVLSSIYITRCQSVFGTDPTPAWRRTVGEVLARITSSYADCIRASWASALSDPGDSAGMKKFKKIWCTAGVNNFYVTVHTIVDPVALANFTDGDGPEPPPIYRIKLSSPLTAAR